MIMLNDIWPVANPREYKIHFAKNNGSSEPLDVLVGDADAWKRWQEYRPRRNLFNREFIFSLARVYYETDSWMFGGVFRVSETFPDRYEVNLTDQGKPFIGRLKLRSPYRSRQPRVNMEGKYDQFEVLEILPQPYSGRLFPGFELIDLSFPELEVLVRNDRLDWRAPLESVKGVYLIAVRSRTAVRRYVGAAYGEQGIWSRWVQYAETGHGGTAELRQLMADRGLDYCRQHFRFALLEHMPRNTSDESVQDREIHWKKILGTRGRGGLNRN